MIACKILSLSDCMIVGSMLDHVGGGSLSSAHACRAAISNFESYCIAHTASTLAESYHLWNPTNDRPELTIRQPDRHETKRVVPLRSRQVRSREQDPSALHALLLHHLPEDSGRWRIHHQHHGIDKGVPVTLA